MDDRITGQGHLLDSEIADALVEFLDKAKAARAKVKRVTARPRTAVIEITVPEALVMDFTCTACGRLISNCPHWINVSWLPEDPNQYVVRDFTGRVLAGPFRSRNAAEDARDRLRAERAKKGGK